MQITLLKPLYKPLSPAETSPFDAVDRPAGPEMAFRLEDRHGPRYERAVLVRGVSGKIDWLWPGRIPLGRVTLVEGPPGAGKSFLALDLAARLSTGRPWPDGALQALPDAKAVICSRQDDEVNVIGARLESLGADWNRCLQWCEFEVAEQVAEKQVANERIAGEQAANEPITAEPITAEQGASEQGASEQGASKQRSREFGRRPISLPHDLPALEHLLSCDPSIRLVVIDPLCDFCRGKKALSELMHRLNRLAAGRQVAIVVTLRASARFDRHGQLVVKSRYDADPARCAWCCVPDPELPGRSLFLPTLMNFAQKPPGMGFRLAELAIGWENETVDSARPLRSESECERWLRELLQQGDFAATEIKRLGADLGYSESGVRRARLAIGATHHRVSYKKGSKVYWSLGKGSVGLREQLDRQLARAFTGSRYATMMSQIGERQEPGELNPPQAD